MTVLARPSVRCPSTAGGPAGRSRHNPLDAQFTQRTRRGFRHVYRGDAAAGVACFEWAIRLSPLDPFSFNCFVGLGLAAFASGNPVEAANWTQRAIRGKGMTWAYRDLAVFLVHAAEIDAARAALTRFAASRPDLTLSGVANALGFMEPTLLSRYLEGLRLAGFPD